MTALRVARGILLWLAIAVVAAPTVGAQTSGAPAGGRASHPQHGAHGHEDPSNEPTGNRAPAEPVAHDHSPEQAPGRSPGSELPPFIPRLTEEDRKAAFPAALEGHAVHDRAVNYFVLFDELEWSSGDRVTGLGWDNEGWVGRDLDRFWFRTEGAREDGRMESAQAHLLYGRAVARWWDVVAGVRQDVRPGTAQTWAAVGVQGLAPYWFDVEATAYFSPSGRTQFRFEAEYELLLTNRLILQPTLEADVNGTADAERGLGAGLSEAEGGLRLRYELRREFAPYVGVVWGRKFFGTADLANAAGEETSGLKVAAGVRFWF